MKSLNVLAAAVLLAMAATAGGAAANASSGDTLTHRSFGTTPDGRAVELYTLRNSHGMEARIATYGGIVTFLTAPDRTGHYADVVLGYDTLVSYLVNNSPYFGALIGRYANRIAHGTFELDGRRYTLARNDGDNALHGGRVGFDKVVWSVAAAHITREGPQLVVRYRSRDGEEGYPGKLSVSAVYTLTEEDALRLELRATTDRDTVVNLTQHSYFNLRGSGDILGHLLQIDADRFTPVDGSLIPTGELRPVTGTAFDFRQPTAIGARIDALEEQLRLARGYDHNFIINGVAGALRPVASVYEPTTGRALEVLSTEPGLQLYSGNFLDGSITGKEGRVYRQRSGLCLEPQHFPDSPNHANFPSTVLRPHQEYHSTIVYRFSARKRRERRWKMR